VIVRLPIPGTLINQEKVFALLASYGSSPTTAAMNEVFGTAKVPLVGAISGADSLRQSPRDNPKNRYMFNVRASYANETEAIVNQLVSLGFKNIAVFYQNDGFGKSGLDGVVAALRKHNQAPSAVATVERNSVDVSSGGADHRPGEPASGDHGDAVQADCGLRSRDEKTGQASPSS
jgi:branched-chain amino acid transport system substrate-binding protein